jgi:hypothetical protein
LAFISGKAGFTLTELSHSWIKLPEVLTHQIDCEVLHTINLSKIWRFRWFPVTKRAFIWAVEYCGHTHSADHISPILLRPTALSTIEALNFREDLPQIYTLRSMTCRYAYIGPGGQGISGFIGSQDYCIRLKVFVDPVECSNLFL